MAASEVIQEYLVKVGYVTDAVAQKKTEDGMLGIGKKVFGVGTAVAGLVAAVGAATTAFAYSMRNMYFQSELSKTTVKNMEAMSYAGEQIGVSGDVMKNAIHGMAQAVRLNPGLQGLIESFGIKVTGRDMSDVMMDYVHALKQMPEFAGAQYAGMFGIDPDTFHQMMTHMGELSAKKKEMRDMYKEVGYDPDLKKNQEILKEYANLIDKLEMKAKLLGQALLTSLVGPFKEAAGYVDSIFNDVFKMIEAFKSGEGLEKMVYDLAHGTGAWEENKAKEKKEATEKGRTVKPDEFKAKQRGALLSGIEKTYNLPAGTLKRVVSEDEEDQQAYSRSALAAGQGISALSKKYGGNTKRAIGEYSMAGEGTRLGAGAQSGAVSVTQTNTFHISGKDSTEIANKVADKNDKTLSRGLRAGRGSLK